MHVSTVAALCAFVHTAAGQHHHHSDPFSGSGCTCDTFCNNTCAINGTKAQNVTLYRMTPYGAWDMKNKNTGDARGDTSFVLSRKTAAYECRMNPHSFMCQGVTQFAGDDPNSTDVVQQYTLEIDGQWGPYLYCNPVNSSLPDGDWACTVSLSHGGGVPEPPQCSGKFELFSSYCLAGTQHNVTANDEGACCATASAANAHHFTFYNDTGVCSLSSSDYPHFSRCPGAVTGVQESKQPPCNCTRVHQTVGRENLTAYAGGSSHPAGGFWYSHPEQGECTGAQRVGDGSGCTWRVVERVRAVKASCMYQRLDAGVEGTKPACFAACGARNVTSNCYLRCYSEAVGAMTIDELTAPWFAAFKPVVDGNDGACPDTPDNFS